MAIVYTESLKNLVLDAAVPITEDGEFRLLNAGDTVLGSATIPSSHFSAATGGEAAAGAALDIGITVAGTATKFRVYHSGLSAYRSGTVGTSGADLNFSSNVFGIGDTARILTWRMVFS